MVRCPANLKAYCIGGNSVANIKDQLPVGFFKIQIWCKFWNIFMLALPSP